jgi:hypothetical protein
MPEAHSHATASISEELMLARLAQSEQMREFFIQMWLQNPALARQAGTRVQEMLLPLTVPPAGRPSGRKRPEEAAPTFSRPVP